MSITRYVWDYVNDSYLMEKDATGATQAVYTNEPALYGRLVSQRRTNHTNYYHYDAQLSTRQLTNANQVISDTYHFAVFGRLIVANGPTVNHFLFSGCVGVYHDDSFGTLYIRARYYDARVGRWASAEPFIEMALYVYADNNPLRKNDPSGLIAFDLQTTLRCCKHDAPRDIVKRIAICTFYNHRNGRTWTQYIECPAETPLSCCRSLHNARAVGIVQARMANWVLKPRCSGGLYVFPEPARPGTAPPIGIVGVMTQPQITPAGAAVGIGVMVTIGIGVAIDTGDIAEPQDDPAKPRPRPYIEELEKEDPCFKWECEMDDVGHNCFGGSCEQQPNCFCDLWVSWEGEETCKCRTRIAPVPLPRSTIPFPRP